MVGNLASGNRDGQAGRVQRGVFPYLYNIIHVAPLLYQLAFFTPGRFPASASILKVYWIVVSTTPGRIPLRDRRQTHPRHLEVPEDTPRLPSEDTPVPNLRRPRVSVHLRQLQLRLGPHARRERRVPDNVPERLPGDITDHISKRYSSGGKEGGRGRGSPLRLVRLDDLALRVVADDARVDEAAQVELLRPEHRHLGWIFSKGAGLGSGGPLTLDGAEMAAERFWTSSLFDMMTQLLSRATVSEYPPLGGSRLQPPIKECAGL